MKRTITTRWLANPAFAEGEVTIEVRVTDGRTELDEPDPPSDTLNRYAWDRIQERYGQAPSPQSEAGR
ncbi:MAG: hypothetical protein JNG88_13925 [Phycisphaerales bacterium]|nr:hypothetical protein [Phycisphaerales bacterium]